MIHAKILLTNSIIAYAILVAMEERNLDMPHGPQSMEHEAAPQHEAPTDHSVAAEGSKSAGIASTAPMLEGGRVRQALDCGVRDGRSRDASRLLIVTDQYSLPTICRR